MTKLWQGAATSQSSLGQKKWLCALALLYGLGLRRGEMTRLNVKDWQLGEGLIRADVRKTRKQLSLPLQEMVARCMEAYLPEREEHLRELGKPDETALFLTVWERRHPLEARLLRNLLAWDDDGTPRGHREILASQRLVAFRPRSGVRQ